MAAVINSKSHRHWIPFVTPNLLPGDLERIRLSYAIPADTRQGVRQTTPSAGALELQGTGQWQIVKFDDCQLFDRQLFDERVMTDTSVSVPTSPLPRFEEARGLGPQDAEFVRDLVAVLARHGNLNRFGLCLLHDHFPIAAGEVLVETNDSRARTLLSGSRGEDGPHAAHQGLAVALPAARRERSGCGA
jgi:hypothetical protein